MHAVLKCLVPCSSSSLDGVNPNPNLKSGGEKGSEPILFGSIIAPGWGSAKEALVWRWQGSKEVRRGRMAEGEKATPAQPQAPSRS